jgi:hypothetical protein
MAEQEVVVLLGIPLSHLVEVEVAQAVFIKIIVFLVMQEVVVLTVVEQVQPALLWVCILRLLQVQQTLEVAVVAVHLVMTVVEFIFLQHLAVQV